MNHNTATAYGCVAYRIMKDEGKEESEEYLELLMETLYDFYNGKDILAIYRSKIKLDFYDVIVNDEKIKKLTNGEYEKKSVKRLNKRSSMIK